MTFTVSESVLPPSVTVFNRPATTIAVAADTAGLTYTSTYTIASGDVGPIKYVIALADSAGNTASIDQTDSTRAAGMLLWFGMHLA